MDLGVPVLCLLAASGESVLAGEPQLFSPGLDSVWGSPDLRLSLDPFWELLEKCYTCLEVPRQFLQPLKSNAYIKEF